MDFPNYVNKDNFGSLNILGGVAYNNSDYGNFLWGQAGKRMGFSFQTLKIAAHVNNAVNSPTDNPNQPYHILDSEGDQRAIKNGYNYWIRKPKGLPK